MSEKDWDRNVGAAILGLYGAIRICRRLDIPWQWVGEKVEEVAIENERKEAANAGTKD